CLPFGAVPEPVAHRDPICAAHRTRRGRAHVSFFRRRLCRKGDRMADVLRDLRAGVDPEPCAAGLVAKTQAFRDAGACAGLAYFTTLHLVMTASVIWPASWAQDT